MEEKITEEQYQKAIKDKDEADKTINQYWKEEKERFEQRMKEFADGKFFTDDELLYSRTALCPCGHGLAYPKKCHPHHHWDCSAILKGIADKNVEHTGQLPFSFYDIKGEQGFKTTRGVFIPKDVK